MSGGRQALALIRAAAPAPPRGMTPANLPLITANLHNNLGVVYVELKELARAQVRAACTRK